MFVGPSPEMLRAFGDKVRALATERDASVTVARVAGADQLGRG